MPIRTETFTGADIAAHIAALARLRMTVFSDWPYLYEGSEAEERGHLAAFAASPDAALVVAFEGDDAVGCSTCLPLAHEPANIRAPFDARGWDVRRFCYFGESVLLRACRGHGVGLAFFAEREAHARRLAGVEFACFCAVRREADDPRRPAGAVALDEFWRKRGFSQATDLACTMTWPEVGGTGEATHRMDFWVKPLGEAALP